MKRRIFIGDIQGCREELERLLERVRFDPAADDLQPVGDLVNRGPDSLGTLRLLVQLDAGGVLGNHDVHTLRTAHGFRSLERRDTIADLLSARDRDELLAWLAARPFVRAWEDGIAVHAGLDPTWSDPVDRLSGIDPLTPHRDSDFAVQARYCAPDGTQAERDWPPPGPPFQPWWEYFERDGFQGRWIVFGHWSRQGLLDRPKLKGLDTGCVWGQNLTAWIPEEERIVQVRAARAYASHGGSGRGSSA